MSENVRSTRCRPSGNRSRRWMTMMMIVAMFGFAGHVFAGIRNNQTTRTLTKKFVSDDPQNPAGDELPPAGNLNLAAVPPNDKCAGAIELFLNISEKVDSVGAKNDYQTPATTACYPQLIADPNHRTQVPTTAPGGDVVFSFTAPDSDKYSFRLVVDAVTNDFRNQNGVLYLVNGPGCFAAGTVDCLQGTNRESSRAFSSAVGSANNHGEEIACVPLTGDQKVYVVFDDAKAGNAGSNPKLEVIRCPPEEEPNDTPATANPYVCNIIGTSPTYPAAHCHQGSKDGQVCARTTPLDVIFKWCDTGPNAGKACSSKCDSGPKVGLDCIENAFCNTPAPVGALCAPLAASDFCNDAKCDIGPRLGQSCTRDSFCNPNVCDIGPKAGLICTTTASCNTPTPAGAVCAPSTGASCAATFSGGASCVAETDLDCDPRCVGGPNNGLVCSRSTPAIADPNGFCNPAGDVGATCQGTCVIDSVCVLGPTPGVPCTATCNGGARGPHCSISTLTECVLPAGTGCPVGETCNPGQFCSSTTLCGTGFACISNLSCGNGTVKTPELGKCSIQNNEGDADFFSLGSVPAGSKIFTGLDANTANDYDWRMRVTTGTDTLQFDDDDGNFVTGDRAPVIAGAVATGGETYIKVSRTQPRPSEPYHLNAIVRGPLAAAQLEDEAHPFFNDIYYYWPGDTILANAVTAGGYVKGILHGPGDGFDSDCFKFCFTKGDLMDWYGDGNPERTFPSPTLPQLAQPIPYDLDNAGISNFIFGADARRNDLPSAPSAGLNGLTPAVTSSYENYRATYTGSMEVCFYEPSSRVTPAPRPAYVEGPYAGSLSANCGPVDDCVTIHADIDVTKTGPVGPVNAGDLATYTIAVHNNGPGIAADLHFQDFLDPNVVFVSLKIHDGFDTDADGEEGDGTFCFLQPTPGQNDAFFDCINATVAPGATTTYIVTVQVNNCIPGGTTISNTATVGLRTPDDDAQRCDIFNIFTGEFDNVQCETATHDFLTAGSASCNDLDCSTEGCTVNLCTTDTCDETGACVSVPNPPCSDDGIPGRGQGVCTEDSCIPATGCFFDSSQLGDLCANSAGNKCLHDYCDSETFCQVEPTNCDDNSACTTDSCTPAAGCAHAVVDCNDNDACTDDSCVAATGCQHPATNCDDSQCCTNDLCDTATGCYHTPNTTPPTFVDQPTLGAGACGIAILWPPSHGYVDFTLGNTGVSATSQCGIASIGFRSCQSNQEDNAHGTGDGNSTRDCVTAFDGQTLSARAERDGACSPLGRVYTADVIATDNCGNTAVSNTLGVGVWHDRGHSPRSVYFSANPGSNQNDTRLGNFTPGLLGCGGGLPANCDAIGQTHDSSDADPEMEISQQASISVDDLRLQKTSGGAALLTWTEPTHVAGINVTRFHVYRLDPITLFWTQIAEVSKQTTSYLDPVLGDGLSHQYKIAAVIKP